MNFDLRNKNRCQVRWLTSGFKYTGEEFFTLFSTALLLHLLLLHFSTSHTPQPWVHLLFWSIFLLSILLFFFLVLSLEFSLIMFLCQEPVAFYLCVCIAGIGMDLFIVVTLAAWSLKAALLSRAKTLARSAHFCLLCEHYLPSGAFKSTSAKHHFQERGERERGNGRLERERKDSMKNWGLW